MAAKKTKKTETKAPVKKTVAVTPVAPKAPVKKAPVNKAVAETAPAKKVPAKKAVVKNDAAKKTLVSQERFYAMVSEAAYFASQNDGNQKGSTEYWLEAEEAVRAKFDVA